MSQSPSFILANELSATDVSRLEKEGVLLRVLKPSVQKRIRHVLTSRHHEAHAYVVVSGDQMFISVAHVGNDRERKQILDMIRQCQIGSRVDLSGLPAPLRHLLEPDCVESRRLSRVAVLSGFTGVLLGILAMAISIPLIAAVELVLHAPLHEFGGMQITAVAFVIFTVLGWMLSAVFFARRIKK